MISNSDNQTSSKKRQRENSEDEKEAEKIPKVELNESDFKIAEYSDKLKMSQEENQNENVLTEINSMIYKSQNKNAYLDVIWKTEIPRNKFTENLKLNERLSNKEGVEYNLGLLNVFYSGSQSGSLVLVFQNGNGLSDEDFKDELNRIEEILVTNDIKINAGLKESNGDILHAEFTQNSQNKINGDSGMDIDNELEKKKENDELNNSEITFQDENENKIENVKETETVSLANSESQKLESNSNRSLNKSDSISSLSVSSLNSNNIDSVNNSSGNNSGNVSEHNSEVHSNSHNSGNSGNNSRNSSQTSINKHLKQVNPYQTIDKIILTSLPEKLKGKYYDPSNRPSNDLSEYCPSYDINISLNLINHKNIDVTLKDLRLGEIIIKEIPINSLYYNCNLKMEDPIIITEILMRKNYNYNTEFTGIVNEAMTCYMNSMLQTLNVLGYFKKAVFKIPILNDEELSKSVAFSLQRLFYDLMNENDPISTNRLIHSFGWSRDQIFVQHDVQEFNLLLCDIMENRMKGTNEEGTFKHLFEGKVLNYIECIDVDYKSNKIESFCDLQLTVKGCKNIYESLNKYTEEEILDGEDKYHTEDYGKQKAKKGIKFTHFPNVLIMQLKRFEYNPRKDQMDKINDYFEYYDEIDISRYVVDSDEKVDNNFSLHSVVVHRGGINSGHYYAFIRPYETKEWYQFNDEVVRKADWDEVFTYNYGIGLEMYKHKDRGQVTRINPRPDGNAYILVYIRNSMKNSILSPVNNSDIPQEIKDMIEKDKLEEKRQELLRQRKINNINVYLIAKENILNHRDLGILPSFININLGENLTRSNHTFFNLPKELPVKDFMNFISDRTKIPVDCLLLYTYFVLDPNKILKRHDHKMNHICQSMIDSMKIADLYSTLDFRKNKFALKTIYLYIECIIPDKEIQILELNKNIIENENLEEDDDEDSFDENEFHVPNEEKSIIYIPLNNRFVLKQNEIDLDESIAFKYNNIREDDTKYKLLIVKYLHVGRDNNYSLKIDDIIPLEFISDSVVNLKTLDFNVFKQNCLKYLGENLINIFNPDNEELEVNLVLEKTSGDYLIEKTENKSKNDDVNMTSEVEIQNLMIEDQILNLEEENETVYIVKVDDISKAYSFNTETDSLIVIVNLKLNNKEESLFKLIDNTCENLFNNIYVPIEYAHNNGLKIDIPSTNKNKFIFNLSEDEEMIYQRLFNYLKMDENLIKLLLDENIEMFYLDSNKRLLTQDKFIEEMTKDNLVIIPQRGNFTPTVQREIEKYPILKFVGAIRSLSYHRILFIIRNMKNDEDFDNLNLNLFDINNNPIVKLSLAIPNNLTTCEEILNYIYEIISPRFYGEIPIENLYFMIQQRMSTLAYDIFVVKNYVLTKYDKMKELLIEYRLQPYSDEEIEKFPKDENIKLFVALITKEGNSACDPLIIFISKDSTVKEVKNIILEKMIRINKLESYGEITLQKIKFYTYTLINYRPNKDILLLNSKDDECVMNYFKNRGAYNLLVEFLISKNGENPRESNTSFLDNGMSLSVDNSYKN